MKRLFFILLLSFTAIGCIHKEAPHIPGPMMEKILFDVQYAEIYSMMVNDSLHQTRNKNKDSLAVYYKDILNHYNITQENYLQSIQWYKEHPQELDSIYSHILQQLTVAETGLK